MEPDRVGCYLPEVIRQEGTRSHPAFAGCPASLARWLALGEIVACRGRRPVDSALPATRGFPQISTGRSSMPIRIGCCQDANPALDIGNAGAHGSRLGRTGRGGGSRSGGRRQSAAGQLPRPGARDDPGVATVPATAPQVRPGASRRRPGCRCWRPGGGGGRRPGPIRRPGGRPWRSGHRASGRPEHRVRAGYRVGAGWRAGRARPADRTGVGLAQWLPGQLPALGCSAGRGLSRSDESAGSARRGAAAALGLSATSRLPVSSGRGRPRTYPGLDGSADAYSGPRRVLAGACQARGWAWSVLVRPCGWT